jgi:hypothetical protein
MSLGSNKNPYDPTPISQQNKECNMLEIQYSNGKQTMEQAWDNCVNDSRKNLGKEKTEKEKRQNRIEVVKNCCESVMQCNNPNEWFLEKNIKDKCTVSKPVSYPHFSSVKHTMNDLMYGVY